MVDRLVDGAYDGELALCQRLGEEIADGVLILLHEAVDIIRYLASVVNDYELRGAKPRRPLERLHVRQLLVDGLQEVRIRASRLQHELLVEQLEERGRPRLLYHVDSVLVVFERNRLPLDPLLLVLFLLKREHVLVELLLQLLIRVVDRELLERVLGKDLKAKDIEQADEGELTLLLSLFGRLGLFGFGGARVLDGDRGVDLLDDPAEHRAVEMLAQRVSGLVCLVDGERAI